MSIEAGYIECALWCGLDEEDEATDAQLSDEAVLSMNADVQAFLALCEESALDLSELDPAQIGHDFWLTRNRHGAGFWDRGIGKLGDQLTTLAHSFGESILYVGDDGNIYVS